MYHKSNCNCYKCKCEKKKDKCPKSEPCCQFKYNNNVLGKPGDIVEVIPSKDYNIASVQNVVCDKEPEWLWASQNEIEDDEPHSEDEGVDIDKDCDDNSYVTGLFKNTISFGNTLLESDSIRNLFVAKTDHDGNWIWANSAGGPDSSIRSRSISTDCKGNSYITGSFGGTVTFDTIVLTTSSGFVEDIFVAKIDSSGKWLWAESAGGTFLDSGNGISVDCDGDSYITGCFGGIVNFGSITLSSDNAQDIFAAKIDTDGNWVWANKAGGNGLNEGRDISVDCNNNSYVTGSFQHTATFGSIVLTSDEFSIFVAKLDDNGVWSWVTIGAPYDNIFNPNRSNGIEVDCKGNSYITGFFENTATFGSSTIMSKGSSDIFVAKVDNTSNWIWATSAGGMSADSGNDVSVDCKSNPYITGSFVGTASFGSNIVTSINNSGDVFVAKLDESGNWLWVIPAGGNSFDRGNGISVDCKGNSYITGFFKNTATFGNHIITIKSKSQGIFAAKVSSTNLGTLGFLQEYAQPNQKTSVCFPGGVIMDNTFNQDLKPGNKYYIDCKCKLSTCCKCAKQFVGIACSKDKMITGIKDNCCTKH